MGRDALKVLLIGEGKRRWSHLTQYLERMECTSWFASANDEVSRLVKQHSFNLALSTRPVTERSPLMQLLKAPNCTVFYSIPVERSYLWFQAVPEVLRGPDASPFRPSQFMKVLDTLIVTSRSKACRELQFGRPLMHQTKSEVALVGTNPREFQLDAKL